MVQICGSCSRANPDEATYCFYDGGVLPLHGARGRLNAAIQPFALPLAFTPDRNCLNFEQLLRACQEEWDVAVELLRRGTLASFFAQVGRQDLAETAARGARAADPHVALDEFLTELPGPARRAARLRVKPTEVLLGPLRPGEDRTFTLALTNLGERLVSGTAVCDQPWLSLGDQAAVPEKSFRFHEEWTLPVRVLGKRLFAGPRPHEGTLSLLSSTGSAEVRVRVEVPSQPFPAGALAGARTPRELVARIRAAPAEAVPLFDSGEVAAWYHRNGWTYPVAGPSAAGPDAVRQFFAALGLPDDFAPVKAPVAILVPSVPGVTAPAAIPLAPLPVPVAPAPAAVPAAPAPPAPGQAFDKGPLAGVRSPRELVARVRAAPAEAVPLFDSGEVAAWYQRNGWTYPVAGPSAAGPDAVRQFFMALGLPDPFVSAPAKSGAPLPAAGSQPKGETPRPDETPAPAGSADSSPQGSGQDQGRPNYIEDWTGADFTISLRGSARDQVRRVVQARAKNAGRRPLASARATCDQSWLSVQVTRLDRDAATILLEVPTVPDLPGTTLQARVNVTLNGQQRMTIPVTLTVAPLEETRAVAPGPG